jgi:hypothetical protein
MYIVVVSEIIGKRPRGMKRFYLEMQFRDMVYSSRDSYDSRASAMSAILANRVKWIYDGHA